MPWYRNTNDGYGDSGPFEAASKEAFADEVDEVFQEAALDDYARLVQEDPDCYESEEIFVAIKSKQYREHFIAGLEEVRYYTASCNWEFVTFEAESMEQAVEHVLDLWSGSFSVSFDAIVTEYLSERDRDERFWNHVQYSDRHTITIPGC